jgi:hypothetical protein
LKVVLCLGEALHTFGLVEKVDQRLFSDGSEKASPSFSEYDLGTNTFRELSSGSRFERGSYKAVARRCESRVAKLKTYGSNSQSTYVVPAFFRPFFSRISVWT